MGSEVTYNSYAWIIPELEFGAVMAVIAALTGLILTLRYLLDAYRHWKRGSGK